jgi:hypothetical protein
LLMSISRPDLLNITDENTNQLFFGATQDWYSNEWHRGAGCGPTCAGNLLAYLALTRPELRALYGYEKMILTSFSQHMEEVYEFVTPGFMGLNKVEMFSEGSVAFAASRGLSLHPHVFRVPGNRNKNRPGNAELTEFVMSGLESDCPVAFLNLTRGKVKSLQAWHWITIVEAKAEDSGLLVTASDEGKRINFDLYMWYLTTRMSGGLVYFTS